LHESFIRCRFGIRLAFIQSVKKKDTTLMRGLLKLSSARKNYRHVPFLTKLKITTLFQGDEPK